MCGALSVWGVVLGTVFVFAWLRVAVCGCGGVPGVDSDMG